MKKSIIAAGAASVALAAMPIVGAFAAPSTVVTSQTDTLIVNIGSACSIGYNSDTSSATPAIDVKGVDHADGTGAWGTNTTTSNPGDADHPDTLSATMLNESSSNAVGTTTLGVYCNNENGYTISAGEVSSGAGSDLSSTTVSAVIPLIANFGNGTSGTATGWSFQVAAGTGTNQRGEVKNGHTAWSGDATAASGPKFNQVIAGSLGSGTKTTSNDGDFFTITYGVGIDGTTPAATYKGAVKYTLATL